MGGLYFLIFKKNVSDLVFLVSTDCIRKLESAQLFNACSFTKVETLVLVYESFGTTIPYALFG